MAFEPSYNILDKDTHNMVVEAFKSGGIGYTEADGTVHKISGDYVEGGGGGSSLPEVSAADNGDVLTVVEGEWAKAAPSGGAGIGVCIAEYGFAYHDVALKPVYEGEEPDIDFRNILSVSDDGYATAAQGAFPLVQHNENGLIYPFWYAPPFSIELEAVTEEEAREAGASAYLSEDITMSVQAMYRISDVDYIIIPETLAQNIIPIMDGGLGA